MNKKKDKTEHNEEIKNENVQNETAEKKEVTDTESTENAIEKNVIDEVFKKLENAQKETNEYKDLLLRRTAEFENYKRRTENEMSNLLKYAAENFIVKILPIYDDIERSLKHTGENNDSVVEGIKLVFNKFSKIFEEQGIKKIDNKNEPFDFNLHEALMQQPVAGVPDQTVIEIVEPGYIYKDKVIRHAKVIVSQEINSEETK